MKSEPKWPEKILSIRDDDYDKGYYRGRNIAIDVCITAFNEWLKEQKPGPAPTPELKLCRCQRHKDAAFSVRRINDDFHSCPSCGGLLPVKTEKPPEVKDWEKNLPKPFESRGDNFLPCGWYYEMDDIIPVIRSLLAAKTREPSLRMKLPTQ